MRERGADRRSRGEVTREELAVDGVHLLEVADVLEVHVAAGDLRVVGATGAQDRADLLEDGPRLCLDALLLTCGLARDEEKPADNVRGRVRVGVRWGTCVGDVN